MKQFVRRRVAAVLVGTGMVGCFVGSAVSPGKAGAYALEGGGCRQHYTPSGGRDVVSYDYGDQPGYETISPLSAGQWNNTGGVHPYLARVHPGGTVSMGEYNYGATGFAGITSIPSCSGGYFAAGLSATQSRLNTYYTNSYPNPLRLEVGAHELGHALGLDHNASHGSCATTYLMYPSAENWTQCGINAPKSDDINGVDAVYP